MGFWSFYFLAKIYMLYKGFMRLDIILNLVFAAFVLIPVPEKFKYHKAASRIKLLISIIACLFLLWHDSWFPPPLEAIAFIKQQGLPSKEYIYGFLLGYLNIQVIALLALTLAACIILNMYLRLTPFVIAALLIVIPLTGFGQSDTKTMGQTLETFYDSEQTRTVAFNKPKVDIDFDIIFIHICSLSWDDLRVVNMDKDHFFKQFNYLFTDFNTATTYSGPAVTRLLLMNCGQPKHDSLYDKNLPNACFLVNNLTKAGFEPYLSLNHDGKYGDFLTEISRFGRLTMPPVKQDNIPIQQHMFDESNVYDDYFSLEKWWKVRSESKAATAALYYNTVTLHDGVHWLNEPGWFKRDKVAQFKERLAKLFKDLKNFFKLLEATNRNFVVVFVPEHGMSLKGSTIQTPGLRDIPLPSITLAPLGIKFIGEAYNGKRIKQVMINKPLSHFSIAHQLATFIEKSPFTNAEFYTTRQFIDKIPITDFVAENQGGSVIMRVDKDYYLHTKEKKWIKLMKNQLE